MSDKNKPLPKPPSTPFGRKKAFNESGSKDQLMADKMAMAMTEGKLDEFVQKEIPDSEHARKLTEMMMGMSGMMPAGGLSGMTAQKKEEPSEAAKEAAPEEITSAGPPPDGVVSAVQEGDVKSLVGILNKEHKKRQGIEGEEDDITKGSGQESASASGEAVFEKEVIEQMIKIATDNNLSLDWLFIRALKRYVEDYKKTGNL